MYKFLRFEFRLIVCFTTAHPSFTPDTLFRAETLCRCENETPWPLNTTWVHLELSDTHDTFILSLKHLKQKIIKVYTTAGHTFYNG